MNGGWVKTNLLSLDSGIMINNIYSIIQNIFQTVKFIKHSVCNFIPYNILNNSNKLKYKLKVTTFYQTENNILLLMVLDNNKFRLDLKF